MRYFTNIIDCNKKEIFVGMFLVDINCKYLTYQVRIRNDKFVIHTGGSYNILTTSRAKFLRIINDVSIDSLGYGHYLFKSSL